MGKTQYQHTGMHQLSAVIKIGIIVVAFTSGIILNQVLRMPECPGMRSLKNSEKMTLKYPRVFPAPQCTQQQTKKDKDGICRLFADFRMRETDRQTHLQILDYFILLAKKHKWTHFLAEGSLLGSWRHHAILPWDYDIDLLVDIRHREEIAQLIGAHPDYNITIDERGMAHVYSVSKASLFVLPASSRRFLWPFVDLLFYNDNGTHVNSLSYPVRQLPRSVIFPLHNRPFEGFEIPAPRDPVAFLIAEYGLCDDCKALGLVSYKCEQLKDVLPFVHRDIIKGKGMIRETLKHGDQVIHVKDVDEDPLNLPKNPYSLETVANKEVLRFPPDELDMALVVAIPINW